MVGSRDGLVNKSRVEVAVGPARCDEGKARETDVVVVVAGW